MVLTVRRESAIADTTPRRSPPTSVMSEAAIATSAPVPMAIPTSARASAAASLRPSPTMPTTCPPSCNLATCSAFSRGNTSAITWSMPTWSATARAVAPLSPVSIQTSRPSAFSCATASADSSLTGSATTTTPAGTPSTAASIGVRPADAASTAKGFRISASMPSAARKAALPTSTRWPATPASLTAPAGCCTAGSPSRSLARSTTTSFGSPASVRGNAIRFKASQNAGEALDSVRALPSAPCAPGRACSIDQHFRKSHGQ